MMLGNIFSVKPFYQNSAHATATKGRTIFINIIVALALSVFHTHLHTVSVKISKI